MVAKGVACPWLAVAYLPLIVPIEPEVLVFGDGADVAGVAIPYTLVTLEGGLIIIHPATVVGAIVSIITYPAGMTPVYRFPGVVSKG